MISLPETAYVADSRHQQQETAEAQQGSASGREPVSARPDSVTQLSPLQPDEGTPPPELKPSQEVTSLERSALLVGFSFRT